MHQRLASSEHMRLRSVLRKSGHSSKKQRGRSVTFNESLNLFYEAECSCWIHEDDYAQMRQEEHERREREEQIYQQYEPIPPIEFEDTPTLSPPEGYKDRFFPQELPLDPDVTRVSPPSPPAARRKVFLKDNPVVNGQDEDDDGDDLRRSKSSRLGGILKGGRLWRSNSAEGKKVSTPPDEPDVVKCSEASIISGNSHTDQAPLKVSTGTAPLRTSEQIRLAVDSTLRSRAKKKPECSSLVEKLRWLTSLDDDDSSDSNASGFATWPSRDKNGTLGTGKSGAAKTDAGTSTSDEFVPAATMRQPPIHSASEAKIKQISYTLEDIDEGLKSGENELESFVSEDGGRIERIRKRYGDDVAGDDYGFSRRPSVKGIKPKFSSTNQIFAQFTMRPSETPIPTMESTYENTRVPVVEANSIGVSQQQQQQQQQQAGNLVLLNNAARMNYEFANAPGRQTEESRAHFEMIRQSFEPGQMPGTFNRPHSWSVSTLPHPHHHSHSHSMNLMAAGTVPPGSVPPGTVAQQINNFSGPVPPPLSNSNHYGQLLPGTQPSPAQVNLITKQQQQLMQQQLPPGQVNTVLPPEGSPMPMGLVGMNQNIYSTLPHNPTGNIYGTLPHPHQLHTLTNPQNGQQFPNNLNAASVASVAQQQQQQQQQQMYGTVRRVPNVIGRPLFLHYGALSVEAHPNKIVHPRAKVPETPSPTQQPPPIRYYGPPIRYYNPPPPVPPRTAGTTLSSVANNNPPVGPCEPPANSLGPPNSIAEVSSSKSSNNSTSSGSGNPPPGSGITTNVADYERGVPEGANDDEPAPKEAYSMNV